MSFIKKFINRCILRMRADRLAWIIRLQGLEAAKAYADERGWLADAPVGDLEIMLRDPF